MKPLIDRQWFARNFLPQLLEVEVKKWAIAGFWEAHALAELVAGGEITQEEAEQVSRTLHEGNRTDN